MQQENQQLKHNRDKALKKLNKYRNRKDHYAFYDENLKCRTDDRYSIVKVMKAEYKEKRR